MVYTGIFVLIPSLWLLKWMSLVDRWRCRTGLSKSKDASVGLERWLSSKEHLLLVHSICVLFLALTSCGAQLPVTLDPWDAEPSFDPCGHLKICTYMHTHGHKHVTKIK